MIDEVLYASGKKDKLLEEAFSLVTRLNDTQLSAILEKLRTGENT